MSKLKTTGDPKFFACPAMLSGTSGSRRCAALAPAMADGSRRKWRRRPWGLSRNAISREKQPERRSSRPHHVRSKKMSAHHGAADREAATRFSECGDVPSSARCCGPKASRSPMPRRPHSQPRRPRPRRCGGKPAPAGRKSATKSREPRSGLIGDREAVQRVGLAWHRRDPTRHRVLAAIFG